MEKAIYSYLYGINRSLHKKVKQELKFGSYDKWKEYIQNKYKICDSKTLKEFRRYLCQDMRSEKPIKEYWKICIPICISMIITSIPEMVKDMQDMYSGEKGVLTMALCICIVMIFLILFMYKLVVPLWDSNTKENLLTDYKEIIDEMIGEKLLEESMKKEK